MKYDNRKNLENLENEANKMKHLNLPDQIILSGARIIKPVPSMFFIEKYDEDVFFYKKGNFFLSQEEVSHVVSQLAPRGTPGIRLITTVCPEEMAIPIRKALREKGRDYVLEHGPSSFTA